MIGTIQETMALYDKLTVLSDAAKYDVACTSAVLSGTEMEQAWETAGGQESATVFLQIGRCISPSEDSVYERMHL